MSIGGGLGGGNKKGFQPNWLKPLVLLAERTGLEPATSGVTGRHSNQLNYRSSNMISFWWAAQGLNL